jgi:hypothetical protein
MNAFRCHEAHLRDSYAYFATFVIRSHPGEGATKSKSDKNRWEPPRGTIVKTHCVFSMKKQRRSRGGRLGQTNAKYCPLTDLARRRDTPVHGLG